MTFAIWIGVGTLVLALVIWRLVVPSLDSAVDLAAREKDLAPLLKAIEMKAEAARPTAYNHAIRRLWDGFQRRLAVDLIRELAMNHGTSRITQYWLKHVRQVEPGLAREQLGREFYDTYYLPELAAQCGPVG